MTGENLEISFELASTGPGSQKLIVDYIIHHVRSNKTTSPKVFKLKTFELKKNESRIIIKKHSLKIVSTRKYYRGVHTIEIQINGAIFSKTSFELLV